MQNTNFDDRPDAAKRLELARKKRGFKTAVAAARFFGWNYMTYAQHEQGIRGITRAVDKYAKAFRVTVGWLLNGEGEGPNGAINEVPLKGNVGAGQIVEAVEDNLDEYVEAPKGARPETVALRIIGDSMFPAYEEGTLIYYSRILPPAEMVNRRCIAQLADGRIFVKILRPGSKKNLWTLQSLNALYPDMVDQVVEWAAPIDWIRPR